MIMKKTKLWTVPEVNFSCRQEKTETKNDNARKTTWSDSSPRSTQYLLHTLR